MRRAVAIGAFLVARMAASRLRPLLRIGYDAAVAVELFCERVVDQLSRRSEPPFADLTVVVKTFERPRIVRRLVRSVRRLYPDVPIVVVDDSRRPQPIRGAELVPMPYDSGIAAGRNEGVRRAETPYVLVLDDDFVFSRNSGLGHALELLTRHQEIDVMGGQLVDLPLYTRRPLSDAAGRLFPTAAVPRVPLGSTIAGLVVVPKVPTFFLARRERLLLVGWDPLLRRIDHADFFTRALGTLTTVFNPELTCFHARTPFDDAYMAKRLDLDESRRVLAERYGSSSPSI